MPIPDAIFPRELVAERFAVSTSVLVRFEARGLVHAVRQGDIEGYEPSEIRRIWTVLSLERDLGINLAGIEAILKLRSHIDEIHAHLRELADDLRDRLEHADERSP